MCILVLFLGGGLRITGMPADTCFNKLNRLAALLKIPVIGQFAS